jgi:DNA-directed RNA polymerase subunit A'
VLGERIQRGYRGRTLPHFAVGDLSLAAHGFVANSFKRGLNPFEYFFDLLSGREGLMDKSLRTRHSGYLERRLMNALQDLKVEYDYTVRDNRKLIVQFTANEDGIDPAKSDWGKLDVGRIIDTVIS